MDSNPALACGDGSFAVMADLARAAHQDGARRTARGRRGAAIALLPSAPSMAGAATTEPIDLLRRPRSAEVLEPACVTVCPTGAIIVGDLDDPSSAVARIVQREAVAVRRPEKETHPKVFYKGAHAATLDPLAARRPAGGLFLWSEQPRGRDIVASGHPERANSSAAALLAYDVAHRAPWDWRVSLYTWTKGIAAGVYLVGLLLVVLGETAPAGALWRWAVPITASAFVAATGIVLIADLEHPARFYLIFTRHHGRSWLV